MKKIIIALFLLLFIGSGFLLYLKLTEEVTLKESLDDGRSAFASKALLQFSLKDYLPGKAEAALQIKIGGQGQESSYRLRGRALAQAKGSFFLERRDGKTTFKPKSVSALLPSWIKNWISNSRLLLAEMVFSSQSQKQSAKTKEFAGQEALFYHLRRGENFLQNIISKQGLSFKKGTIAFSKESSLPIYIEALYQGEGLGEGVSQEITITMDWQK